MRRLSMLVLTALAAAQQPPQLPLSMKQAVDLALAPDGSARLQMAREVIRQSEARADQSRAALLPNSGASFAAQNFTRNLRAFGISIPLPGVPEVVGPVGVYDWRAAVTQTVFDFGAIRRMQAGRAGIEAARAEEDAARNVVATDAARAYLTLQRAAEAIQAAEANVSLATSLHALAVSRKEAGDGTGIEVTRAQVQLANEQQRLLTARNDRDRAAITLLRVIGADLGARATPTDILEFRAPDAVVLDDAIRTARERRPDLRAQSRRETVSRLNYGAVKSQRLPTVSAYADLGGIGTHAFDPRFTRTLGVSVNVPLFDGGLRSARRAEAASQLRQDEIRARDLSRQVEAEVRLAMESLESAEGQVKTAEQGLALAGNELAQARRRYEAGVGASIEVADAQTRLARARDNRLAALYLHALARIELASAMGVIHEVIR